MRQSELRAPDVYGRIHELDEATLGVVATRLEGRGRHPFFVRAIDDYLAALALEGAEAILDIGCGTGVATRAAARRAGQTGKITGVDISAGLIEAAEKLALAEGVGDRIAFRAGDAHSLGLAEESFDVVLMHTLISHVAGPAAVLAEARRLLKSGTGRLVVFDGDYASLSFATGASDGGAATDAAVQRGIVANPRVMRAMPRLLEECGFALLWSQAYVVADIGRADFWAPSIASLRVLLPRAGVMRPDEAASWADALERDSEANRFFATSNFFSYVARPR